MSTSWAAAAPRRLTHVHATRLSAQSWGHYHSDREGTERTEKSIEPTSEKREVRRAGLQRARRLACWACLAMQASQAAYKLLPPALSRSSPLPAYCFALAAFGSSPWLPPRPVPLQ